MGLKKIIKKLDSLAVSLPKNNVTKVGIIIDQDDFTKEERLNEVNECIDKIFIKSILLDDIIAVFSRVRGNKILERLTVKDSNTPHSCDYRYNANDHLSQNNTNQHGQGDNFGGDNVNQDKIGRDKR